MTSVVIHPGFNASYYSFYIQGLIETFGESNIRFSAREFPELPTEWLSWIYNGERQIRIAIDAYDGQITLPQYAAMDWCDVFGKVNLRSHLVFKEHIQKCLAIGPSFGIRTWPVARTLWLSLKNYRLGTRGFVESREHFGNYWRQYRYRLGLDHFTPGPSLDNYVFCVSSLWSENQAPRTNELRAAFMNCCKTLEGITFEGGFIPTTNPGRAARYQDQIVAKRYPYTEWLEKTKRSALVFNNPAVWQCHGWKLGEYLALGKAIVSSPLVNDLPAPLVHGEQMHYVDGSENSLKDAIQLIVGDRKYRQHLERNARQYFETYLTPRRVIERLIEFASQGKTSP
jgi:hypothetical protein